MNLRALTLTILAAVVAGPPAAAWAATAATPTFSPLAGTYSAPQTVALASTTPGAKVYYTTNGTTPTTSSTLYMAPVTVGASTTLKGLTVATGYTNSAVGSATYTLVVATPTFSPAAGTYGSPQTVAVASVTPGAKIYYTTNGTTPTTSSTLYSSPVTVGATTTLKALAVASGYTNSAVSSAAYTMVAATPTFSPAAGTYSAPQAVAIASTTPGAKVYYTTNGATPTTSSTLYSVPVAVGSTTTLKALAFATGYTNSSVGSATYTMVAATPTFSPAAGTYGAPQTVVIATTTPGAKVYYTTGGATPTTSSTLYSVPVAIGATATLKALAVATGYTNSAVGSATYTINLTAATPTFSPAGGTYTTAQSVSLASSTPGAKIYYTTNGTTPTTSSSLYSTQVSVTATTTLEALAVATGYSNSAVATATYTMVAAPPTLSPSAGSYAQGQSITISDATPGVTIYVTTDGSTPTAGSPIYAGPLSLAVTMTVRAMAVAPGYGASPVVSATYIAQPAPRLCFAYDGSGNMTKVAPCP